MPTKRNSKEKVSSSPRGRETRERLLSEAIRIFAEKGYDGVSVDEIVAAAKVNKRMVYHYFGSKEDLYCACLAEIYLKPEGLELRVFSQDLPPAKALEKILEAYFEFLAEEPEYVRLLLWENLSGGRALKKHPQLLSKAPLYTHLQEIVQRGVEQGIFSKSLDADILAISMFGLCFIYYSNRYTLSQGLNLDLTSPEFQKRAVQHGKALLLHGVTK